MTTRKPSLAAARACLKLLVWTLPLSAPVAQAQLTQPESSTACQEGVEPLAMQYGDYVTGCGISPATDLDRFNFTGAGGDLVRINVLSLSAGLDPVLEIRDPQGDVIDVSAGLCFGNASNGRAIICSFQADATLPGDGTYQLSVSDSGTNEPGNYTLQLERLLPAPVPPEMFYDIAVSDVVEPHTDTDFFSFEGRSGTDIQFNVLSTRVGFDPVLEIWDPQGTQIDAEPRFCFGNASNGRAIICSFQTPLPRLTQTGRYHLAIHDSGGNELGSYEISLQCLFGPCPPTPGIAEFPPAIIVNPTAGLSTTEAGGSASFSVVLNRPPSADVMVGLRSDNEAEGNVDFAGLTFTPTNWNTPQTVTVTGVDDDGTSDGDVDYRVVTAVAVSDDADYDGLNPADVAVTNVDDDVSPPAIYVGNKSGDTGEDGTSATFQIGLTEQPQADVMIAVSSSDPGEGTAAPDSLTFTADNWSQPQTVTVNGRNDADVDGDQNYRIITAAAVSGDVDYDGLNPADVEFVNVDDDARSAEPPIFSDGFENRPRPR